MPEQQKPAAHATTEAKPATPKANLVPAGESGDPDVHRLLAERQSAATNLAAVTPDEGDEAKADEARTQIADIDKQLAALGFSAG